MWHECIGAGGVHNGGNGGASSLGAYVAAYGGSGAGIGSPGTPGAGGDGAGQVNLPGWAGSTYASLYGGESCGYQGGGPSAGAGQNYGGGGTNNANGAPGRVDVFEFPAELVLIPTLIIWSFKGR